MMTGQLLGGASPLMAAEYQMAILWCICGTAAISTYLAMYFCLNHAVFDAKKNQLTVYKIMHTKKNGMSAQSIYESIRSNVVHIFCCLAYCDQHVAAKHSKNPRDSTVASKSRYDLLPQVCDDDIEMGVTMGEILRSDSPNGHISHRATCTVQEKGNRVKGSSKQVLVLSNINVNVRINEDGVDTEHALFAIGRELSFTLLMHEIVCVQGVSGLGKTRLLKVLAHLESAKTGRFEFFPCNGSEEQSWEIDSSNTTEAALISLWRQHVIYIPQVLFFNVISGIDSTSS